VLDGRAHPLRYLPSLDTGDLELESVRNVQVILSIKSLRSTKFRAGLES
jgi:hypothetical protein